MSSSGSICKNCRFSLKRLQYMAELGGRKEMFTTFGGRNDMNIYEVNPEDGYLTMRRSTGKLTRELSLDALAHVHDLICSGKLSLYPDEIDELIINGKRELWRWGNYVAALLKHLGCRKH